MLTLSIHLIGIIVCFMSAMFIIAQIKKDNSIADIAWGIGFVIVAWYSLYYCNSITARKWVAVILTTIWALRLSIYIAYRKKGHTEDARYRQWRKSWGNQQRLMGFLKVFMLQGFFILLISTSTIIINCNYQTPLQFSDFLGIFIWLAGFLFETIADIQLYQFNHRPHAENSVLTTGLWKYSRHPNYFGETLMWIGLFVVALASPYGWIALISPVCILAIFFGATIKLTEEQMINNHEYKIYQRTTSIFIPRKPYQ